ncbi:hypothetical protein OG21DRAFT_1485762 [Imleria badia]|nr:hypothetical protein OG21DRAFT_1485762 [Imleria badia]
MGSELTLVNLAPPTAYFLSSADLKDAVIYANPGLPLYRITSDARHIKIYDGTTPSRIIAILHRRDLFPDTISFPQRHSNSGTGTGTGHVSVQRWLKRSKLPDGTPTFTIDTEYGPYVWKSTSRYRQKVRLASLALSVADISPTLSPYFIPVGVDVDVVLRQVFAQYDLENPIASCYLHPSLAPSKPALILQSSGEPLRDDIIVAYLVQRHRVTMENKALDLFVGPS